MEQTLLELSNIVKEFPGVVACENISFKLNKGEFLGIVGENGAGKSTLMNIISGVYDHASYAGDLYINGERAFLNTPNDAESKGIGIIHQELNLIPELTVAENIFLHHEPTYWFGFVNHGEMNRRTKELLKSIKLDVDPHCPVKHLSMGKRQMVEIAKAMNQNIELLILDEPTSSLTEAEIEQFYELMFDLKQRNFTCIFISHKLNEIFKLCERVHILKDGCSVGDYPADSLNRDKLISLMVGRDIQEMYPKRSAAVEKEEILRVENFSLKDPISGKQLIDDVSFSVYTGELLVFSGLIGAGRTELMLALLGAYPKSACSGTVRFKGRKHSFSAIQDAIHSGISYIVEDRKDQGLNLAGSVVDNINISSIKKCSKFGFIETDSYKKRAEKLVNGLRIKTPSLNTRTANLSGGNQQKVLVARAIAQEPELIIFDEPTRGVDVGAKIEIYKIMNELIEQGKGVIMVSSDLLEVIGMADRVVVLEEGSKTGELTGGHITEENVLSYAMASK